MILLFHSELLNQTRCPIIDVVLISQKEDRNYAICTKIDGI
jgi:hypothetical protein